jgi:hypothetical protein
MIDSPERRPQRFPPEAESVVAEAIVGVFTEWGVDPRTRVLSQGARGTDILVAEAALVRGAEVSLMLALPPEEFARQSVSLPRSNWDERFRALLDRCEVFLQSEALGPIPEGESPFGRNNRWVIEEAFRLGSQAGAPVRALVVWDGQQGDDEGGTSDFVEEVRGRDAEVRLIEPRQVSGGPNLASRWAE